MKKTLISLSFALAATIAVPVAAGAQDANSQQKACCRQQTECSRQKNVCRQTSCAQTACINSQEGCANTQCTDTACAAQPRQMKKAIKGNGHRKFDRKFAQNGEMKRAKGANPLFKGITLTEEQQKELTALRESKRAERAADKAEMKKRSEAFDKEVEKILTPDQLKQFKANKEAMEKFRKDRRK